MSARLVVDNDHPIPLPVDPFEWLQSRRPDCELFAESLQHDDEQAQAHGWSKIAAFGFACFFAGCLFTAALALIINHLPSARAIAASDRNAPRSAQHIATVDAGSDKGIPS